MEIEETQNLEAEAVETTNEAPAVEESKAHPAWDKMLAELPEVLHSKVTPYLQEQDRNFQQQLEKFTPFKDFVEQGINPEMITAGLNLVNAIEENPIGTYESLQAHLREQGLLKEEAKAAAKEIMEEQSGENFEDLFDESDPNAALKKEIKELKDAQSKQEEFLNQQQLQAETEKELQALEAGMSELKGKYQISEAHEIAIYDLMNNALTAGREMTLMEAAGQLSQMIGGFKAVNSAPASASAPTIVGSSGGAGVPSPEMNIPKSDKDKRAMLGQLFEEYRRANNA